MRVLKIFSLDFLFCKLIVNIITKIVYKKYAVWLCCPINAKKKGPKVNVLNVLSNWKI